MFTAPTNCSRSSPSSIPTPSGWRSVTPSAITPRVPGQVYRFLTNTSVPLTSNVFATIFGHFQNAATYAPTFDPAYFHPVADGVVHLKIRAFDQAGNESVYEQGLDYATSQPFYEFTYPVQAYTNILPNNQLLAVPLAGLPTAIQLEVGVLEPEIFQQLRALPMNSAAQKTFLAKAGGNIQIYRQNIPIPGATR